MHTLDILTIVFSVLNIIIGFTHGTNPISNGLGWGLVAFLIVSRELFYVTIH